MSNNPPKELLPVPAGWTIRSLALDSNSFHIDFPADNVEEWGAVLSDFGWHSSDAADPTSLIESDPLFALASLLSPKRWVRELWNSREYQTRAQTWWPPIGESQAGPGGGGPSSNVGDLSLLGFAADGPDVVKNSGSVEGGEQCVICHEDFLDSRSSTTVGITASKTWCGHWYHRECLEGWVRGDGARPGRTSCPACRQDIMKTGSASRELSTGLREINQKLYKIVPGTALALKPICQTLQGLEEAQTDLVEELSTRKDSSTIDRDVFTDQSEVKEHLKIIRERVESRIKELAPEDEAATSEASETSFTISLRDWLTQVLPRKFLARIFSQAWIHAVRHVRDQISREFFSDSEDILVTSKLKDEIKILGKYVTLNKNSNDVQPAMAFITEDRQTVDLSHLIPDKALQHRRPRKKDPTKSNNSAELGLRPPLFDLSKPLESICQSPLNTVGSTQSLRGSGPSLSNTNSMRNFIISSANVKSNIKDISEDYHSTSYTASGTAKFSFQIDPLKLPFLLFPVSNIHLYPTEFRSLLPYHITAGPSLRSSCDDVRQALWHRRNEGEKRLLKKRVTGPEKAEKRSSSTNLKRPGVGPGPATPRFLAPSESPHRSKRFKSKFNRYSSSQPYPVSPEESDDLDHGLIDFGFNIEESDQSASTDLPDLAPLRRRLQSATLSPTAGQLRLHTLPIMTRFDSVTFDAAHALHAYVDLASVDEGKMATVGTTKLLKERDSLNLTNSGIRIASGAGSSSPDVGKKSKSSNLPRTLEQIARDGPLDLPEAADASTKFNAPYRPQVPPGLVRRMDKQQLHYNLNHASQMGPMPSDGDPTKSVHTTSVAAETHTLVASRRFIERLVSEVQRLLPPGNWEKMGLLHLRTVEEEETSSSHSGASDATASDASEAPIPEEDSGRCDDLQSGLGGGHDEAASGESESGSSGFLSVDEAGIISNSYLI